MTIPAFPSPLYQSAVASPTVLGQDVSAWPDLDPNLALITGNVLLGQDLARRFITPSGGLWYASGYGTDLRQYLLAAITPLVLVNVKASIERECEKDLRVQTCVATVQFDFATETLAINIQVWSALGPFAFTLTVNQLTGVQFATS